MAQNPEKIETPTDPKAAYLRDIFFDVGPVKSTGVGAEVIPFSEIESFQRQTGIHLNPWEVLTLRSMSKAYAIESITATQEGATPPWIPTKQKASKEEIQSATRDALRALSHKKPMVNHG